MANVFYNVFKSKIGTIDWSDNTNVTIKIMLLKDTYTPDIDNHKVIADVNPSDNEVSSANYTAGGAALLNRTITEDDTNDLAKYDADDVTWSNVSFTTRGAVIYHDTGDATTSTLLCYIDFDGNQTVNNSDFSINFSADGVFSIS